MPIAQRMPEWIWSPNETDNQYTVFVRVLGGPDRGPIRFSITASHHYELYVNGEFINRGPVHCDPAWCQFDEIATEWPARAKRVEVAILVHHARGTNIASIMPSRGGLCAEINTEGHRVVTDSTWCCLDLPMWRQAVPARGWALGYCEDYDARLEPVGWARKRWSDDDLASWPHAVVVANADDIWGGYSPRITPYLERREAGPVSFRAWRAPGMGASDIGGVSGYQDTEDLAPVGDWQPYSLAALDAVREVANAFTFDLGVEHVGHYSVSLAAPAGTVVEVSGAELLRNGRPWVLRKNTRYSVRYTTREGEQTFTSFSWSGFRYLHVVVRGDARDVRILRACCAEKRAPIEMSAHPVIADPTLERIFELCRHTLAVAAQEHLIDCPTREQAQYWGDGVFIAESLWSGFGEPSYMKWYLECFLHVPVNENGQINCIYPGMHSTLLTYSLVPILGQRFYKSHRGSYYRPAETLDKALQLKEWYDARRDAQGLVAFDYEEYARRGMRNFIDHPGVGWHRFPHPGIDRQGTSCPLNLFFYGFLRILADMASELDRPECAALSAQADDLAKAIRHTFYDGTVFHDAIDQGALSEGTSWQANALAVYFTVIDGNDATRAIRAMLDGYDRLCRCSPYFHFYFLPALAMAGLHNEALALIKHEWGPMLDRDATTTWEGFLGDEKDSLCHPWSTAPLLYMLTYGATPVGDTLSA